MNEPGGVDASTLARLTAVKTVVNTALRWVAPFLPTLERAFDATTAQLTTVLGIGELAGLSPVVVGRRLDRGQERWVLAGSLGLVAASGLIALLGHLLAFAVSFFVLVLGVANYTVAGQTWISRRVAYQRRARALGLFETSWAFALLIGGPLVAIAINVFGWRGPFVAIAVTASIGAVVVLAALPPSQRGEDPESTPAAGPASGPPAGRHPRPTATAWLVMLGSAATAMAGLSVFVVSGSWLEDEFGVSTGGIGVVVVAFGGAELLASLASAAVADRAGKLRTTVGALVVLAGGLALMAAAGDALVAGVAGLVVFLLGFEYAFVTSLSLVSETMPDARGATLAVSNAVGTVARAVGATASGWLYSSFGLAGTVGLAGSAAVVAGGCLVAGRSRSVRRLVDA